MSETLNKSALLEWLRKMEEKSFYGKEKHALHVVITKIESGRFDIEGKDRVWKEGQEDGALAVFAHILYEHGIDIREASIDHPKVKELAERYGVKEFID